MLNYNLQLTDNRNERFVSIVDSVRVYGDEGTTKRKERSAGEWRKQRTRNWRSPDGDRSISRITISRIGRRGNDFARRWPVNDAKFHPLQIEISSSYLLLPSIFNQIIQFFNLSILCNNKIPNFLKQRSRFTLI